MSQFAYGINGRRLIGLFNTEAAAEAAQRRVVENMKHDRADGEPALRAELVAGTRAIDNVPITPSGITQRWDDPVQIPSGPHAGRWMIHVPSPESRINRRNPQTGASMAVTAPEWAGTQRVEVDPSWWPAIIEPVGVENEDISGTDSQTDA